MKFGHHVVMAMQREQAFWWPWVSVPHIAPPTTRMFKEALMAMVVVLNSVQLESNLSPFTQECRVHSWQREFPEVPKLHRGDQRSLEGGLPRLLWLGQA